MLRRLLTPKWIAATLIVLVLAAVFLRLGFWQLSRLDERREANSVGQQRFDEPPADLDHVLSQTDADIEEFEYQRVFTAGTFDVESEVLVRSQVYRGTAGFHVITPLVKRDGSAVLINRGWIPLTMDTVPVSEAPPVPAEGRVEGWIHLTQTRPRLGPQDSVDGELVIMSRVDVDRIQQQVEYRLEPVYLVMENQFENDLPVPVAAPSFDDEGPHLAYSIQWFGFAAVLLIGYFFFVRRQLESSG